MQEREPRKKLKNHELTFENGRVHITDWNGIRVVSLERGEEYELGDFIHEIEMEKASKSWG